MNNILALKPHKKLPHEVLLSPEANRINWKHPTKTEGFLVYWTFLCPLCHGYGSVWEDNLLLKEWEAKRRTVDPDFRLFQLPTRLLEQNHNVVAYACPNCNEHGVEPIPISDVLFPQVLDKILDEVQIKAHGITAP
jgi:hypothetical protein